MSLPGRLTARPFRLVPGRRCASPKARYTASTISATRMRNSSPSDLRGADFYLAPAEELVEPKPVSPARVRRAHGVDHEFSQGVPLSLGGGGNLLASLPRSIYSSRRRGRGQHQSSGANGLALGSTGRRNPATVVTASPQTQNRIFCRAFASRRRNETLRVGMVWEVTDWLGAPPSD